MTTIPVFFTVLFKLGRFTSNTNSSRSLQKSAFPFSRPCSLHKFAYSSMFLIRRYQQKYKSSDMHLCNSTFSAHFFALVFILTAWLDLSNILLVTFLTITN